ncbi:MAG: FAD-binding oxidoreductase [Spirochaetes bacterium]|nr:MAG: FAD-binding oxidoreductase [Spirochaetota bacterium]
MHKDKTYRDILKWGDPSHEETLDAHLLEFAGKTFGLSKGDLEGKYLPGDASVRVRKSALPKPVISALEKIAGAGNVSVDGFERAYHAYGKFFLDLVYLRLGRVKYPPDAVVYPRDEEDVMKLVAFCNAKKIPITPFGGHSSVTRGVETPRGGISLDLTRHMNGVIRVNEVNSTVTVQPGMYGPAFEEYLNKFKSGFTCGHFPQSFEYSTVGGWVVTRGAGQASTGYGKIEDMVLSLRVVTPRGVIETKDYPAAAIGPDIDQVIIGSEGAFGVVTEVTMKIRKFLPANTAYASFIFRDFTGAVRAMREVMQGEFGKPHLFRISDYEETDVAFTLKGAEGSLADKVLSFLGYKPLKRCLMFVAVEGERDYARFVVNKVKAVAKAHGAFATGASPTKKWLEQRYSSAYLRDPLMDLGLMTDTLETAVSWENLVPLWSAVRAYIKARPDTVCMVHISHVYENGANLYFTFLSPIRKGQDADDFIKFHKGIIDTVHANGGSLSHHHGVGKLMAPWMRDELGATGHGLVQAMKDYCDPKGIMNPGGTLGLK